MPGNGWLSARSMAMFAGGASAAFIASRLLPPLVSQGLGSLRAARGHDPLAGLVDDHRRFLRLLEAMENSRGRGTFYRGQLLIRLKRGLSAHAMAEEDVVYPLLREEVGEEAAADRLYAEHGAMKTHLYALERLLDDEPAWLARVGVLKALIETHAQNEENVQFPRLRDRLGAEETARMNRHVQRERALVL